MNTSASMDQAPFISVIIPAYNEEKRIRESLITIQKYLDEQTYSTELIIVDDGSSDQTSVISKECLNGNQNHRIIHYSPNRGKGYAVKKGVLDAEGAYIAFMDADLSTPIDELEPFIKTLQSGYDVVIGTRKNKEAKVCKKQPFFRELLGKGFTLLSNILLVRGISDITCGFKAFRKEAGQDIFRRQLIDNWSFDAETLFLANQLGYKVKEVPVTWYDALGTKVRLGRDVLGSLKGILQIRMNHLLNNYTIKKNR